MKLILLALLTALACTGITAQLPSYLPAEGLVGWWPFNGNANDESGNGNHGTVYNVNFTTDRFGNANSSCDFNGINSMISVDTSGLDFSNDFSLSLFLTNNGNNTYGSGWRVLFSNLNVAENSGIVVNLRYSELQFTLGNASVVSQQLVAPLYSSQTFNHIVVLYESGIINFYLDGVLQYSSSCQINYSNSPSLIFGNRYDNDNNGFHPSDYYNGKIDDIGIWNRALTQQEISDLYNSTPTNNNETFSTSANVPGAISYQAVARDAQGVALSNASVQVQFTLLVDSLTGATEYVETHALTTNNLGLFTTAFGAGTAVSGTFAGINWTTGNKYLNVQIDTGSGWVDIGTQQFLSVPYSMHSATAGSIKNPGLPIYPDNAAAIAGGLNPGDMYRTAAGDLKIVY